MSVCIHVHTGQVLSMIPFLAEVLTGSSACMCLCSVHAGTIVTMRELLARHTPARS